MRNLTPDEQKRLWKKGTDSGMEPVRKILLWGKDAEENNCLLILFGTQNFQETLKPSPNSWYTEGYLLEPIVKYTHYAIFRGMNGHLPSIPNVYFSKEKEILCYQRGYKTAKKSWEYNRQTRRYEIRVEFNEKYIEKEFYKAESKIEFDYYAENSYEDYVNTLISNGITFQDVELIEKPSDLFGFEKDSIYYENIFNMFSKQRLYSRIKNLKEFIQKNPSEEDYQKILNVASVELACGIFQELTISKNAILLEQAKQILNSKELWAKKEYHNGLKRFVKNYVSLFDEKLMQEQKDFIYQTLPEMDFHAKRLKIYGEVLTGKKLEEYIGESYNIYGNRWTMQYGRQKIYDKNTYTDGTNVKNVAFKNTIQMAKVYDMADVIGKISYYLDAPRTKGYFLGSDKESAYNYYQRYLRRIWNSYKANDESKFVETAREFLAGWQDNEDMIYSSFFFYRFLKCEEKNFEMWDRHIDDIIYVVKNATNWYVLDFCYAIIERANKKQYFDNYDIKELIALSQITHNKIAALFENLLMSKLKAAQVFDTEIMLTLMNMESEKLQNAAKEYFIKTKGKFKPQDIVELLSLDTIEKWYKVVETNIDTFSAEEYIIFIKALIEKGAEYPENINELLQNSTEKLNAATTAQKQVLLQYFMDLILQNKKMSDFIAEMSENMIFYMPYEQLKEALQDVDLKHGTLTERNHNVVTLLKAVKEDIFPKDSAIISILETSSSRLVKTLTETIDVLKESLSDKTTTILLLLECNVYALNKIAQTVFENLETEKRQKMHMLLLDSPIDRTYQYALKKLEDWYGDKIPKQFIVRMMEHPCVAVKSYLSSKMEKAFDNLENTDLYIYYIKTVLYLPNKATKSKENIYSKIPEFVQRYPQKRNEIEAILLDIGSTNVKINAERALVAFAQIQKEVQNVCK